jgi:hypothetical protein
MSLYRTTALWRPQVARLAQRPKTWQPIMNMTGFTDNQLEVRGAIQKLCVDFPDVGTLIQYRVAADIPGHIGETWNDSRHIHMRFTIP